jgi:hypothetical protein
MHYTQEELYYKQRDKITKDLNKLKKYEADIKSRIGRNKIKEWIFLTPTINDNKLLKHSQKKQEEIKLLTLSIIASDFKVILKDADFYATEIHKIQSTKGNKLTFLSSLDDIENTPLKDMNQYEKNISRKNEKRCVFNGAIDEKKHNRLNKITSKKWTDGDTFLRKIQNEAPEIYFQINRVINQYENEVEELCITWQDDAEVLISKIKDKLGERIGEAIPSLGEAERYKIADETTSKWLALCPLNIE